MVEEVRDPFGLALDSSTVEKVFGFLEESRGCERPQHLLGTGRLHSSCWKTSLAVGMVEQTVLAVSEVEMNFLLKREPVRVEFEPMVVPQSAQVGPEVLVGLWQALDSTYRLCVTTEKVEVCLGRNRSMVQGPSWSHPPVLLHQVRKTLVEVLRAWQLLLKETEVEVELHLTQKVVERRRHLHRRLRRHRP